MNECGFRWIEDTPAENNENHESREWPQQWVQEPFERRLQEGLEANSFSTIDSATLPVDLGQICRAARRSEDELFKAADLDFII
jgi:hypothetical protein